MTGTDDIKTIEGVIQCYLDGLYESDADRIASVFHPTSALTSVTNEGEPIHFPTENALPPTPNPFCGKELQYD